MQAASSSIRFDFDVHISTVALYRVPCSMVHRTTALLYITEMQNACMPAGHSSCHPWLYIAKALLISPIRSDPIRRGGAVVVVHVHACMFASVTNGKTTPCTLNNLHYILEWSPTIQQYSTWWSTLWKHTHAHAKNLVLFGSRICNVIP